MRGSVSLAPRLCATPLHSPAAPTWFTGWDQNSAHPSLKLSSVHSLLLRDLNGSMESIVGEETLFFTIKDC